MLSYGNSGSRVLALFRCEHTTHEGSSEFFRSLQGQSSGTVEEQRVIKSLSVSLVVLNISAFLLVEHCCSNKI
jgi:hypothetical protein